MNWTQTKTACHQHHIQGIHGGTETISSVKLYRYDDVLLDDELEFVATTNLIYDLTVNLEDYDDGDDGAYYLEVVYNDGTDHTSIFCIYDLCDAETCYNRLFKYLMCRCQDPCDDECDKKYDLEKKRVELMMLYGLYTTIERLVYYDRSVNYSIYTMTSTRNTFFSQIGRMMDKLKVVSARCGACSDSDVLDITC